MLQVYYTSSIHFDRCHFTRIDSIVMVTISLIIKERFIKLSTGNYYATVYAGGASVLKIDAQVAIRRFNCS